MNPQQAAQLLTTAIATNSNEATALNLALSIINDTFKEDLTALTDAQAESTKLASELSVANTTIAPLNQQVSDLTTQLATANDSITTLTGELTDAQTALTTEQTAHQTDNTANEATIARLNTQVADLTAEVANLQPMPTPDVAPTENPLPDNTQAS